MMGQDRTHGNSLRMAMLAAGLLIAAPPLCRRVSGSFLRLDARQRCLVGEA